MHDNPNQGTFSDYHYVNGGHDILVVATSWGYHTVAGIFINNLNFDSDQTFDWGSHVLNNYHLSNDGSSITNYIDMVGGEDGYGGAVECGIFNDDSNYPTHANEACSSPTDTKQFSSTYRATDSSLHREPYRSLLESHRQTVKIPESLGQ